MKNNSKLDNFDKFNLINIVILVSYIATTVFYYAENIYGSWAHTQNGEIAKWPFNTFLFHPAWKFTDFFSNYNKLNSGVVDFYFSLDLLPLWNSIHLFYSKIPNINWALFLYLTIPVAAILFIYTKKLKPVTESSYQLSLGLIIFIFLSYPLLFALDRSNAEIYCFVFLSIFIFQFNENPKISLVFYVLALLVKPFPVLFSILFLKKSNRYLIKYLIFYYVIFSLLFYLFLFFVLADSDPTKFVIKSTSYSSYTEAFIIKDLGLAYGHSLFGLLKVIGYSLGYSNIANTLFKHYTSLTLLIYLLACIYVYKSDCYWKNISLLVGLMCLLPYVSADYKLLHFFAPISLFILSSSANEIMTKIICILFGLIISTRPFFTIKALNPELIGDTIGISTLFTPILIICLLTTLLISNLNNKT